MEILPEAATRIQSVTVRVTCANLAAIQKRLSNHTGQIPKNGAPLRTRKSYEGLPKLGIPFAGPQNRDYRILVSILGSLHFGKLPSMGLQEILEISLSWILGG